MAASAAQAQTPSCDSLAGPRFGRHASDLPLDQALTLALTCDLEGWDAAAVIFQAGASGDTSYVETLKRLFTRYADGTGAGLADGYGEYYAAYVAHALWELGAPASYFTGLIQAWRSAPHAAGSALMVAARRPDPALRSVVAEIDSVGLRLSRDSSAQYTPYQFASQGAQLYRDVLELQADLLQMAPYDAAFELAYLASRIVGACDTEEPHGFLIYGGSWNDGDLNPETLFALEGLKAMAVEDPDRVRAAVAESASLLAQGRCGNETEAERARSAEVAARFEAYALEGAFREPGRER